MTWLTAVLLAAPLYEQLWRDPAIEQRIEAGMEHTTLELVAFVTPGVGGSVQPRWRGAGHASCAV